MIVFTYKSIQHSGFINRLSICIVYANIHIGCIRDLQIIGPGRLHILEIGVLYLK